ncbi:MAG: ABC transporter permease [Ignavibacteriae bacterium]|nr:ABC transporter permease [Ignavibacteriota bacterium]
MSVEWFIAKRFLQSQGKGGTLSFITVVSILGITLGTAALIITLSILSGFEKEIKDKVIAFVTHIQVTGFQGKSLPEVESLPKKLRDEHPEILSVNPYVAKEGMIRSKHSVEGIYLKGIDLQNVHPALSNYLIEGEQLQASPTANQIIIGKKLARKLNVRVGESVIVFGISGELQQMQPKAKQFIVCGMYESGMSEYDDIYAFTGISAAQQLFSMTGAISGYEVSVRDISSVESLSKQLSVSLGFPYHVTTMFRLYRNLFSWIDLQKKLSPILLVLIIVVATVNILGMLLMFVLEKIKAIGILSTLGATRTHLQRIFFYQGIFISLIGIGLGNILGAAICFLQQEFRVISLPSDIYFMTTVPIEFKVQNFLLVSGVALVLAMITTLLPSRAASRINTISAIRF